MKNASLLILVLLFVLSCHSQPERDKQRLVGGPCEGCEAIYEYGNKVLTSIDTLPLFKETKPKLRITGTVFQQDGSPANDVIIYIYQTNRNGIYETRGNEKGWARRHGFIRGWVKTGKDGKYTFYTFRPVAYPDGREPEHIHITVKEPDKNEYYLDEYVFDDDPLLTLDERKLLGNRGGSGIIKLGFKDGIMTAKRNLYLGLNIPDYD